MGQAGVAGIAGMVAVVGMPGLGTVWLCGLVIGRGETRADARAAVEALAGGAGGAGGAGAVAAPLAAQREGRTDGGDAKGKGSWRSWRSWLARGPSRHRRASKACWVRVLLRRRLLVPLLGCSLLVVVFAVSPKPEPRHSCV